MSKRHYKFLAIIVENNEPQVYRNSPTYTEAWRWIVEETRYRKSKMEEET